MLDDITATTEDVIREEAGFSILTPSFARTLIVINALIIGRRHGFTYAD